MIMLLVPGPLSLGPALVQAALQPADAAPVIVYDAEGKGIGCQPSSQKYKGPGLPKDPPWPPGARPTPSPTPEPTPIVDDPAMDAGSSPVPEESPAAEEPEPSEDPVAEAVTYGFAQGDIRPKTKLLTGLDVSHHNGDIDYQAVKEAGHRFVFIKATQDNDFIDPMFSTNLRNARAAGIAVGAYHFFDYTLDGREQADHFLDRVEAFDGIDDALPPVVDVECWAPIGSSIHAVAAARLRDFTERVYERTGRWPLIYTSNFMWREVAGNAEGFEQLPMWAACWGCDLPITLATGWDEWVFWQEGLTRIPGVGRLDGNYFVGTKKDLRELKLQPVSVGEGSGVVGSGPVPLDLGGRTGTHVRTSFDGETWSDWRRIRRAAPTVTIPAEEGQHVFRVQLKAAPGLRSPIETVTAVVDATPPEISAPVVSLRTGSMGTNQASLPVSVRWDALDAAAGLVDARIAVRCGDGRAIRSEAPGAAEPGERVAWAADAYVFPDASCAVTAITADAAGNTNRATAEGVSVSVVPAAESATVSGEQVGVIARRGPDAGRAAVLLDGEAVGLVDLYAESEEEAAVVFVAELPEGEHTISVADTDGAAITVDGFAALE